MTDVIAAREQLARRVAHVTRVVQLACLLEVSAPKPGNVSPGRRFGDMGVEHFHASAVATGDALRQIADQPIGLTILQAIEATAAWTRANTNLGMVLLLAPLARAAVSLEGWRPEPHPGLSPALLRDSLRLVLAATTTEDARAVYAAIRLAAPGGLGQSAEQDVFAEPTLPLTAVMRLAQDHDDVAREYATGFSSTFEVGAPALQQARREGLGWDDAIVETFLTLLAVRPDTHVRRRAGAEVADQISRLAQAALAAGGVRTTAGRRTIDDMDQALRRPDNLANPGTTADLTAAATCVVLLSGGWSPPV